MPARGGGGHVNGIRNRHPAGNDFEAGRRREIGRRRRSIGRCREDGVGAIEEVEERLAAETEAVV